MLNRRQLLVTSVALPLAVCAEGAASPAAAGPFVAAAGLDEARAAAQAAAAAGAQIVWLGSDITPVYTWLDTSLRRAPFGLAGVTTAHDFFVIERLAWDRGMRTVERVERGTVVAWRLAPRQAMAPNLKVSDTIF
jgi:hypothetical protein